MEKSDIFWALYKEITHNGNCIWLCQKCFCSGTNKLNPTAFDIVSFCVIKLKIGELGSWFNHIDLSMQITKITQWCLGTITIFLLSITRMKIILNA